MVKQQATLTPEQRAKQQVIDSIRALTDYKVYTLGQIEKTLGIPQNTLSGMLSGSRNMAPKWLRLLTEFIQALPTEDKTITIKIGDFEPDVEEQADSAELAATVASPAADPAAAKKLPPPGISKIELQRWYREHQTLK